MELGTSNRTVAAYLVGHGTRWEPRPLELQWARIRRYVKLLASESMECAVQLKPYIDLNCFPTGDLSSFREELPGLFQLLQEAKNGEFTIVVVDLQEQMGAHSDVTWVDQVLTNAGLKVVNAYYDSEGVLEEYLQQHYGGQAYTSQIDDGSDMVAFFPSLAAKVACSALRRLAPFGPEMMNGGSYCDVSLELRKLVDRNPYFVGTEPFIQPELEREWEGKKKAAEVRAARLQSERSFRIAPAGHPLLLDEDPGKALPIRDSKGLSWAEERLTAELKFRAMVEGLTSAFVRVHENSLVFADIRHKGKIHFYVYPLPDQLNAQIQSSTSFEVSDRLSRNLEQKWKMGHSAARSLSSMSGYGERHGCRRGLQSTSIGVEAPVQS